jgi:hypothetical protein
VTDDEQRASDRLAYALYVNDVPISDMQGVLTANDLLGKISTLIQQTP